MIQMWLQGVLAVYIEMTGKKVDKGNDLKDQLCCVVSTQTVPFIMPGRTSCMRMQARGLSSSSTDHSPHLCQ